MLSSNTFYNRRSENTLPSPPQQMVEKTMSREQQKYCGAIMRNLKKHRDASPFLKAVDYVKLNVPDYPSIVKKPMDLNLVESKLNGSEYANVEEFVSDVRLVFNNCFKYNGPEAMISVLCQNVESAFEKGLRQMPTNTTQSHTSEPFSPISPHPITESYTLSEDLGRPKREIHCPSKDYPETFTSKQVLSPANKNQMKYCFQVLRELKKTKYRNKIYPFLTPVDPVALNLPDYTSIIKHPMDLSTIENNLLNDHYKLPEEFAQHVLLMFNNCYTYNPPSLPIYTMAKDMEAVFQQKWDQRPTHTPSAKTTQSPPSQHHHQHSSPQQHQKQQQKHKQKHQQLQDDEVVDDQIAQLERTIQDITKQIQTMKKPQKKPVKRVAKQPPQPKRRLKKAAQQQDDLYTFTFDEKKILSNEINHLPSHRLNVVVEIIKSSMPDLGVNGQKEIELDIDSLDSHTLHQLHDYIHPESPKVSNKGKRQRIHYSERAADKKIHQLEATLKKFNSSNAHYDSSSSSSGSEDDEGSSGSDSE
ncbi:hypothetical protein INT47_000182 [Mucor saturninus]|uniref:Bromodomain-containing protein n=1 Tax=Mucor saturninus TaxID=64648 RepID=A0A8H7R3M2_9FUNG|nr:hypothetical protein INT47_000182 [Mucor saturninus]